MIVLVGASASGKTEVAKVLAKKYGITKMITTTTRNMRTNEINGRDYFFISKDEFQNRIANDRFVEHTVYNGNFYGSGRDQIGVNKCIVVDPKGLKAFIALNNPKIKTFLLEASEATRYLRMLTRGDLPEYAANRIEHDRVEFEPRKISKTDFVIDTEVYDIDQVAEMVYNEYLESIK
jgi:guanylate kinase